MEKTRMEQAVASRKEKAFDCCEAVFVTYHDLLNVPYRQARNIAHTYGCCTGINGVFDSYDDLHFFRYLHMCVKFGIEGMFASCGALCGAILCAAVKENPIQGEVPTEMLSFCPNAMEIYNTFVEKFDTPECGRLCGRLTRTKPVADCDDIIRYCCKLVEDRVFPGMFESVELPEIIKCPIAKEA